MNNRANLSSIILVLFIALVMALSVNHLAQAQQGSLYEMTGSVVAGGSSEAGNYQTDVAIGQIAIAQNTAGPYELGSGFWGGGLVVISVDVEEIKALLAAHFALIIEKKSVFSRVHAG